MGLWGPPIPSKCFIHLAIPRLSLLPEQMGVPRKKIPRKSGANLSEGNLSPEYSCGRAGLSNPKGEPATG
jgi:hypothetical protein